jgi:hypothetical protein
VVEFLSPPPDPAKNWTGFEGVYSCNRCGTVMRLDSNDVTRIDPNHQHRVEDFDGKGRRIRTCNNGSPCCERDAWLWEVKNYGMGEISGYGPNTFT